MPGLEGLPPSLLSIDTDGRVVHLESLSKWICPGTRGACMHIHSHHTVLPNPRVTMTLNSLEQ